MIREFRAMGSEWWLSADCDEAALAEAERYVHEQEQRFSRFRCDSMLSRLNDDRQIEDRDLADVTALALELRAATDGAFDPSLGSALVAAGYDRSFDRLSDATTDRPRCQTPPANPSIVVRGDRIELGEGGAIDLGGIVKGWTADQLGHLLRARGAQTVLIDAGGDLLIANNEETPELIGLGVEGYSVRLSQGAAATSSVTKRRWQTPEGEQHHIISPETALPADTRFALASVVAPDAATADALATALLANTERALPALAHLQAATLVADQNGKCFISPRMSELLV